MVPIKATRGKSSRRRVRVVRSLLKTLGGIEKRAVRDRRRCPVAQNCVEPQELLRVLVPEMHGDWELREPELHVVDARENEALALLELERRALVGL